MIKNPQAAKISISTAQRTEIQLLILRLAAVAVDLRREAANEIEYIPSLRGALDACDALFEELGWGETSRTLSRTGHC
jgi:hypothetical protein